MPVTIKYIGTSDNYAELPVTGKQSVWQVGQQEERPDNEASLLMATGLFYSPPVPVFASTNLTGGMIINDGINAGVRVGSDIDYRAFGSWLQPGQDIGANWQKAVDECPAGSSIVFGSGAYQFSAGAVSRKRIGLKGGNSSTRLDFIPTIADDTFMTWDGVNSAASEATDELQLDGSIIRDLKFRSDRSVRANLLRFRRCDNIDLRNLFAIGFAGSSLTLENSREFSIHGFRTRFNGYLDKTNPHLSIPDWNWIGPATFMATTTGAISGTGSQTFPVSNTIYTDPDGVIIGLSIGASITLDDGTANNRETVVITGLSGLNVTATVAKTHLSGADVLVTSDNTNYCICHDVKLIFPFWDALHAENTSTQTIAGIMIHMIPAGNTTNGAVLEGNIVRYFGGSKGFTGGVANNIFADLHKPVTGNEANCAALPFDPMTFMWAAGVSAYKSKNLRISDGVILGGGTNFVVRAEDNGTAANLSLETLSGTEVCLSNMDISAANSDVTNLTPFSQVGGAITVDTTTDIVTIVGATVPPTGFPLVIKHASSDASVPAGLVAFGQPMYCIRLSATTFKVATTKARALKGLAVDITGLGTGTTYAQFYTGCPIAAFAGAKVFLDPTVRIKNGMQAFTRDSWPGTPIGTAVIGVPTLDSNFAVQNVIQFIASTLNPNTGFAGTQFGIAGEKLGFFGTLPSIQPAAASQAAAVDAATTMTLANALRAALVATGLIKGSA